MGPGLSDAWVRLGAFRGFNPLPLERATFCIEGQLKCGMTTTLNSRPNCLIVDIVDDASRNVTYQGPNTMAVPVASWKQWEAVFKQIEADAHRAKSYAHVCIDPFDQLQWLAEQHLRELGKDVDEFKSEGAGYKELAKMLVPIVHKLSGWGYGWTVSYHLETKDMQVRGGQNRTVLRPTPYNSTLKWIRNAANYLMRQVVVSEDHMVPSKLNPKVQVNEPRLVRYMETVNKESRKNSPELGCRVPLPDRILLPKDNPWAAIQEAWDESVQIIRAREEGAQS